MKTISYKNYEWILNYEKGSSFHHHFALHLLFLNQEENILLYLATLLLSHHILNGSVCIELKEYANQVFLDAHNEKNKLCLPELSKWIETLKQTKVVGIPGDCKPLILNGSKLYLYRYWNYETYLKKFFFNKSTYEKSILALDSSNEPLLNTSLEKLFTEDSEEQKQIVKTAIIKYFCVIAGGPGTGKTSIIIKILILLIELNNKKKFNFALAAPTGKATARLKEAFISEKANLKSLIPEEVFKNLTENTYTIHRLLGSTQNSNQFKFHKNNLLPLDCIIVDECSMVDITLMYKLTQAIGKSTRLILLGDPHQLASVEAGAILAELCEMKQHKMYPEFEKSILFLTKNYRFQSNPDIYLLSQMIQKGESQKSLRLLQNKKENIIWKQITHDNFLTEEIKRIVDSYYKTYFNSKSVDEAFDQFESFIILCALRHGLYGSTFVNQYIENYLNNIGIINTKQTWYIGKPIMITKNNYKLQLYNGDIGIVYPDTDKNGKLAVFFKEKNTYKKISFHQLPDHETCFCMTVHKSQGSEFEKIVLLLPNQETPILTRELIYTAVTRAKKRIEIWGIDSIFLSAIEKKSERTTGLHFV